MFHVAEMLAHPCALGDLPAALQNRKARPVSEAEILSWLTFGAAARLDGRPLLRPVVHAFVRGISGGVVTFEEDSAVPKLWLAAEDEVESHGGEAPHAHFKVTTCTTCGQHYFVAFLKDFEFTGTRPGGGESTGTASFWEPLEETKGGKDQDPRLAPHSSLMQARERGDRFPPTLVVRAGRDAKTLNDSLHAFVAAALTKNAPVSLINYPAWDHGFEILTDTDETRRVIAQSIAWVKSRIRPS